MTTTKLPELPEPGFSHRYYDAGGFEVVDMGYTADQLRAYGEACRATAPAEVGDGDWLDEATDALRAVVNLCKKPAAKGGGVVAQVDTEKASAWRWVRKYGDRLTMEVVSLQLADHHGTELAKEVMAENAALATRPAAPDGWRLVPVEETLEMLLAAGAAWIIPDPSPFDKGDEARCAIYRAMLAAAPAPRSNDNG